MVSPGKWGAAAQGEAACPPGEGLGELVLTLKASAGPPQPLTIPGGGGSMDSELDPRKLGRPGLCHREVGLREAKTPAVGQSGEQNAALQA